jgi:hypothetical protein
LLTLWQRGEVGLSLANRLGSVVAGFIAVALGVGPARALVSPASERTTRAVPQVWVVEERVSEGPP